MTAENTRSYSVDALGTHFFDGDAQNDPALVLHLFTIFVPIFMLASQLAIPINQNIHGVRQIDDLGGAVDLNKFRAAVLFAEN